MVQAGDSAGLAVINSDFATNSRFAALFRDMLSTNPKLQCHWSTYAARSSEPLDVDNVAHATLLDCLDEYSKSL
eukprot:9511657-Lingulodinium_polyedra.AAC.1